MQHHAGRPPLNRAVRRALLSAVAFALVLAGSWLTNRSGGPSEREGPAVPADISARLTAAESRSDSGPGGAQERQATTSTSVIRRDLRSDERMGGHTLARHVGKTDAELVERLRREPQIGAASTYPDVETAERVVGAALAQSTRRIDSWLRRPGPRTNLALNYTQAGGGSPIGKSLLRGARSPVPCDRALVVLRWDDRNRRWIVLTSYPEARR